MLNELLRSNRMCFIVVTLKSGGDLKFEVLSSLMMDFILHRIKSLS